MQDYEIDFLPVGNGERSGDAIAFRFGNLSGSREQQFVAVVDGGTQESGEKLVELIQKTYGTSRVDLVVSTHPDCDHASGLAVVLEKLKVDAMWMHRPWLHSSDIRGMFVHGRITDRSLKETLRASLEKANELEEIARRKGIRIEEPFARETVVEFPQVGISLRVLGPSREYYDSILPHFRDCPETKASMFGGGGLLTAAYIAVAEAVKKVLENWGVETLADPEVDATSAENNSSVILLLEVGSEPILLTADAGVPALTGAADFAAALGIDLQTVRKLQIPHHGSRRNVGPTILNRILGPKLASPTSPGAEAKNAIVSVCCDGDPKHPAKKVLNAFKRRGATCFQTKGNSLFWHSPNRPMRPGYGPAPAIPFHNEVEE
jgi:beta-lactamase superfamily II metal-dependent hydrolase